MEGEAVRDAGWPDTGKSDLHKGRTGAIAFPLAESLECGRPPKSEDHLPHSWDVSRTSTECGPPLAHYRAPTQMSLQRTGECSNLETDEG